MTAWLWSALDWTRALGPAGYAVFALLYVATAVCLGPVFVLTLGAGAAFGVARGFALCSAASTAGACAAFLLGRHLLRGPVERRLARFPAFAAVSKGVGEQGWRVVFLLRLSPLLPFTFLNYAFGLTSVRFGPYALASWLGMMPGTLLYVYLGAAAGEALRAGAGRRERTPAEWALFALGLAATAAAAALVSRAARRAMPDRV